MPRYENDISAKEKISCESSWIQSKNEHSRRKKSFSCQKSKRKKTVISIGRINVAFSSIQTFERKGEKMKNSQSLKKNADFQIVYKEGKSFANKYLVMYVKENDLGINRIGISVSKKVGNSVIRHRIKRLILESYRLHEDMFNSGLDMVIIARTTAKDKSYRDIESAVLHLGKLQHIMTESGHYEIIGN